MKPIAIWPFDDPPGTPVVTTVHVTKKGLPILYVSHELDENGERTWQFHCGSVDFNMKDAQLVRLDTVSKLDPSIVDVADLPVGYCATRASVGAPWIRRKDD